MTLLFAAPALAANAPAGFSSKEPIEINADSLEVRQQENLAIFTGNVIAVQGTTRLKSDIMHVYYVSQQQSAPEPAPAAETSAITQSKVERIEVEGNVLLSSPEETASGNRGTYNVDKQLIHLYGDVVLTRGKNVLKGDTLVYDLSSGKSVVNAPNSQSGGRVKALFVPGEKKP